MRGNRGKTMKRHLKRLAAPKAWKIERKKTTFITRQKPSGHKKDMAISINVFMKEIVGIAKTTKEVKTILHNKKVVVDGIERKDHRFAVGFLDTIDIGGNAYRITLDTKGRLSYIPIDEKETGTKVCRIIKKTIMKGNKTQLNLNDGKNYLVDGKQKYSLGDSVVLDTKDKKIIDHLPLAKNMTVLLIAGKNRGALGKITEIGNGNMLTIKTNDEKEHKTRKQDGFIVGKESPAIELRKA
jgi:small subunit ribosomal protein S4e